MERIARPLGTFGRWLALSTLAGMFVAGLGQAIGRDGAPADASAASPYAIRIAGMARDGLQPASQASFTTAATVSRANGRVSVTATVTPHQSGEFVVDIEIYAPNGRRVDQQWFDREPFSSGKGRQFTVQWTPPPGSAPGEYLVKLGVFAPGPEWELLYHWNDNAATFALP